MTSWTLSTAAADAHPAEKMAGAASDRAGAAANLIAAARRIIADFATEQQERTLTLFIDDQPIAQISLIRDEAGRIDQEQALEYVGRIAAALTGDPIEGTPA